MLLGVYLSSYHQMEPGYGLPEPGCDVVWIKANTKQLGREDPKGMEWKGVGWLRSVGRINGEIWGGR